MILAAVILDWWLWWGKRLCFMHLYIWMFEIWLYFIFFHDNYIYFPIVSLFGS